MLQEFLLGKEGLQADVNVKPDISAWARVAVIVAAAVTASAVIIILVATVAKRKTTA